MAVTGTLLRAVGAVIGGVLIWLWIRRVPAESDVVDRFALAALLAFLVTCVFSAYPRESFDAGVTATAYVAAFYLARRLLARADARDLAVGALFGVSLGLSLSFALAWSLTWLDWLRLSEFRSWPLTDLPLEPGVYRHPQVIGMLVAALLPAPISVLRRGPGVARLVAVAAIACSLLVIFISGSRTTWLAAVVALCVPLAMLARGGLRGRRLPSARVMAYAAAGGVLSVAVLVLFLGAADGVVQRLTDVGTLGARGRIWASSLETWIQDPLTGAGPGTFVRTLATSGFYEESPFTPRHADNALIQLLGEGGLIAVAATVAAFAAWLVIAVRRGASGVSLGAVWAAVFLVLASLGDNPTDTANVVGVLIVWAALAARSADPPASQLAAADRSSPRWFRAAAASLGAVVAVAMTMSLLASARFDEARQELYRGNPVAAARDLDVAVALDPAFALYRRERASAALFMGEVERAEEDLRSALALNPADDAALRSLAMVHSLGGRHDEAIQAARRAVALQRAEIANLVTLALVAERRGDEQLVDDTLVEALQIAPWLPASTRWTGEFPAGDDLAALFARAADEWAAGEGTTVIVRLQPTWLVALAGRPDLEPLAHAQAIGTPATAEALTLALSCRADEAIALLDEALSAESHSPDYWATRLLAGRLADGDPDESRVLEQARLRSEYLYDVATSAPEEFSPLGDSGDDGRMYRREGLPDVHPDLAIPYSRGGHSEWLRDPHAAAERAAPASTLADCS